MSLLALDATGPRAGLAILDADGSVRKKFFAPGRPGLIENFPPLLAEAVQGETITQIAVTIGPGSFTGLRTALALAQGYAAAASLPLTGVAMGEAFGAAFPQLHRPLWVCLRARRGRVFLVRNETAQALADEDMPRSRTPIALAGDAAAEMAARLAAKGDDVMLTNAKWLDPAWVGRAALARQAANLPPRPAEPLYVDPPEAKFPSDLRPPPA